jgi:hypothetical protein
LPSIGKCGSKTTRSSCRHERSSPNIFTEWSVDRGEHDEQRLTVGGLVYLKAVERDHKIKSAQDASVRRPKEKAST